ncbi:unnamed protein product [Calypogeia fissa]
MDLRVGSRGGGLGRRWRFGSRKREELQYSDYSNDYSGLEQQEEQYAQEHHRVAHDEDGAWKWDDSGNEEVIRSKKELSTAIKLGNLYQVQAINILEQDMGSGHFTLAQVLATGQLCNLRVLQLLVTDLTEDRGKAICKALASRKFPSLSRIDLGWNMIGSKGFKDLGRAIQSRRLKNLTFLSLNDTGIDDDDMATLSTAFQHGRASVLPKLKRLLLHNNSFTEVGLGLLAEALKSGRLDSLERVDVSGSSNPSQTGGNALVSALTLNSRLRAIVGFEWHRFPDLDARYKQLRKQKEILRALLAHPKVSASYAKIYLCGSPKKAKLQPLSLFAPPRTCTRQRFIAPWSKKTIEAATKYLKEVGVLIHIDRRFPPEWGITYQRLVILDPNWICRGVIGNIFLHKDMVDEREHKHLFRNKVNRTTGSILISDFKEFFRSSVGEWNESQFDDLITILLWLGLCYNGRDQNVFIPALINENGELGDPWQPESMNEHGKGQWVMGFSVKHKSCEMTLAPMSLWHRFQVELAQTEKFNGEVLDNDFIAGKNFMTFAVDYMNVHITVDAKEDIPTFDEISIFVKPISIDKWSGDRRKQRQVDLANDLLQILLGLWDRVCPRVQYLCRVVWPWPASQPRPRDKQGRNMEVAKVKK